ncbi:hypothetical protein COT42_07325 [Candidatus Saganbacteria bacterium CG08_land_8_20_14_0_20_45_16]|uniref:Uncharacterized protein n=1 Tax=Candidatus Saganbacteria bacterium CG08_land_8_20_14_0_20_45_16 TaxID=2014293 RepID=A0A2H0XUP0_UNCSA|nr:MAG: hypothetical protein COT42_07325 [Candidatus Saganbacteria bacterium CG08_land_8_20_14_0_20_45_16]
MKIQKQQNSAAKSDPDQIALLYLRNKQRGYVFLTLAIAFLVSLPYFFDIHILTSDPLLMITALIGYGLPPVIAFTLFYFFKADRAYIDEVLPACVIIWGINLLLLAYWWHIFGAHD